MTHQQNKKRQQAKEDYRNVGNLFEKLFTSLGLEQYDETPALYSIVKEQYYSFDKNEDISEINKHARFKLSVFNKDKRLISTHVFHDEKLKLETTRKTSIDSINDALRPTGLTFEDLEMEKHIPSIEEKENMIYAFPFNNMNNDQYRLLRAARLQKQQIIEDHRRKKETPKHILIEKLKRDEAI